MALSDIKPLSYYEDTNNLLSLLGMQRDENGNWWNSNAYDGEDAGRIRFDEDGRPILSGNPALGLYQDALAQQGYVKNDVIQNTSGLTPEQALQAYYGAGSKYIDDPIHGRLIQAGNPDASQWNLPIMSGFGNSAFDNFLDSGGLIKLMAGGLAGGLASALTPSLGSIGAGAAVNGGISALTGGNPLAGAVSGGLGGGLSGLAGPAGAMAEAGITDLALQKALIGGVQGAGGALVSGGDPLMAAVTGATGAYASTLMPTINPDSLTFTASGGDFTPSQMDVSVTSSTGNAALDNILAQNSSTFAGLDSITGGGPTTPAPQSWINGLNNPFAFIPPVIPAQNQPTKEAAGGKDVPFFDDLLGDTYNADTDTMDYSQAPLQDWAMQNGVMNPDGTVNWDAFDQMDPYGMGSTDGAPVVPDASWGVNPKGLLGLLKGVLGTGGGSTGGLFGNGGILGSGFTLGNAAAIAPSLAAINYAKNQSGFDTSSLQNLSGQVPTSYNFDTSGIQSLQSQVPNFNVDTSAITNLQGQVPTSFNFDTSKLNDVFGRIPTNQSFDTSKLTEAYDAFDPQKVTGQYDLNTAAARQGLASSLQSRGVAGSSFANSDFANFGQMRDVGRQSLINDATTRRAGIASDILSNDRATAGLNMQGLGLQGQLANQLLSTQQNQAQLGLQGLGLQGQFANQAINAQQQNNAQNLQGLGLRNNMAQSLLDNQYRTSALGLQGQGLQRSIFGDVLNAQIASQKNKNDLYGRALLALSGGLSPKSAGIF